MSTTFPFKSAEFTVPLTVEVRVKAGILSPVLTISPLSFWANDSSENNAAAQNKVTFFISYIF
jgi:hypothetical protein